MTDISSLPSDPLAVLMSRTNTIIPPTIPILKTSNISRYIKIRWVSDENISELYQAQQLPSELISYAQDKNSKLDADLLSSKDEDKRVLLNNKLISQWLLNEINDNKSISVLAVSQKNLANGLKLYAVTLLSNDTTGTIIKFLNIARNITYRALIITLDKKTLPLVKHDLSIEYMTVFQKEFSETIAIKEWTILTRHILRAETSQPIKRVMVVNSDDNIISFQVTGQDSDAIYVSSLEHIRINIRLNLGQYYGWRYLTDSPLISEVLRSINADPPLKRVHNVYIIPFNQQYDNVAKRVRPMIDSMLLEGYQAIELAENVLTDNGLLNLYLEILTRFNYEVVRRPKTYIQAPTPASNPGLLNYPPERRKGKEELGDNLSGETEAEVEAEVGVNVGAEVGKKERLNSLIIVKAVSAPFSAFSNQAFFSQSLSSWLMEAVSLVLNNQLPQVIVKCEYPLIRYREVDIQQVLIKYIALQAYHQLTIKYPYLSTSIYGLEVYEDLSIKIPVSKLIEVNKFKSQLRNIIDNYSPGNWTVLSARTLEEAITFRWLLYYNYDKVNSIALAAEKGYYVIAGRNIDSKDLNPLLKQIRFEQLSQYDKLIDQSIAQSFVSLNELGKGDHLAFVMAHTPIIDLGRPPEDQLTLHMVNREQVLRSYGSLVGQKYSPAIFNNPATGNLISKKSLSRLLFYEHGWLGWFNVGGPVEMALNEKTVFLPGLMEDVPVRYMAEIDIGNIVVNGMLSPDTYRSEFIMSIEVRMPFLPIGSSQDNEVNISENKRTKYKCLSLSPKVEGRKGRSINNFSLDKIDTNSIPAAREKGYRYISLFDLSYPRLNTGTKRDEKSLVTLNRREKDLLIQVNRVVEWLWQKGWFLPLWSTALLHDQSIVTCANSSYAYPFDLILKKASLSPEDGRQAIHYLNVMIRLID